MKKIYALLMLAAFGASAALAEGTLTQVWYKKYDADMDAWGTGKNVNWASENEKASTICARYATGINGKLYSVNRKTMSIMSFDAEGYQDVMPLPSLEGLKINYNLTDDNFTPTSEPDYYGVLMSRDAAGHILVGHGFTTGACVTNFTLVDLEAKTTKRFVIDYEQKAEAPYANLRIDALGQGAGDFTNMGALYIAPTGIYWGTIKGKAWATQANVQLTKAIFFTGDGEGINDNTLATGYLSDPIYLGDNQASSMAPTFRTAEELEDLCAQFPDDDRAAVLNGAYLYSKNTGEFCSPASNEYCLQMGKQNQWGILAVSNAEQLLTDQANNYSNSTGFTTFKLGENVYYVATYISELDARGGIADGAVVNNKPMNFAVFDADWKIVAEWKNPEWQSVYGYTTLTSEVVNDNEANIYIYTEATQEGPDKIANAAAAQFKFTVAPAQSGLFDAVVEDAEVAPVYYNLQGVEVANPENGIYLVRRGNTVAKEYIQK